ncbi:rRNA methyltransferase [Streptosporangium canum]|uniref:rRNA methyltransferase n=1 Tax=Streptosporangium canum TaxID=324952 RepID=UPI00342D44D5
MVYRHATVRGDYEDLASGAVLHSAPGFPAFPVRLASEAFQRALALRGGDGPATVWDPCCGSGYLLTVIGLLHRDRIQALLASDVSDDALRIARANLDLLGQAGLSARAGVLRERAERFAKPSYAAAAEAAGRIGRMLAAGGGDVPHDVRRADVFDRGELLEAATGYAPDIVITDVPYGEQTAWQGSGGDTGVPGMLAALAPVLTERAVVVVTARGRKVPLGGRIRARESFKVGTRAVALLTADQLGDHLTG